MRFYELMTGQKKPLFVPLEGPDGLRERFGLQGKYWKVNDFRRKVIDVAKAELDESSPFSFVAEEVTEGRKIIGWTFYPTFFENREDPAIQEQKRMAKVTARLQIDDEVYKYLKYSFGFEADEINRNKKTLIDGQEPNPHFIDFLAGLKGGAREARSEKASYVIGAIKPNWKKSNNTHFIIIKYGFYLIYINKVCIFLRKIISTIMSLISKIKEAFWALRQWKQPKPKQEEKPQQREKQLQNVMKDCLPSWIVFTPNQPAAHIPSSEDWEAELINQIAALQSEIKQLQEKEATSKLP